MLKVKHPDRYLAAEPVEDLFVNFPILCAEHSNQMMADQAFAHQLMLETTVNGGDLYALQEGVIASVVDSIQAFFKSIVEFFKKLIERLRAAFLSNTQSIDKWKEMIAERYKANRKNAPKYEYEGFKWNPGALDTFRKNITVQAVDVTKLGLKDMTALATHVDKTIKEAENFKDSAAKLKDKEDKDAAKSAGEKDPSSGINMDLSKLGDRVKDKAEEHNAKQTIKGAQAPKEVSNMSDDEYSDKVDEIQTELSKTSAEDFAKKLTDETDITKGLETQSKKIKGGTEKTTIKGFLGLSPDAMMAEINSYDEKSKIYLEAFEKVSNDYQEILNKMENINFRPDKITDKDKKSTSKYVIGREKALKASVDVLKSRQNMINTAANKSMSWHKEMVMEFMNTITNFSMHKFS